MYVCQTLGEILESCDAIPFMVNYLSIEFSAVNGFKTGIMENEKAC